MIKSDETSSSGVYRNNEIEVIHSTFENIEQSGQGNGALINADLKVGSILKINDSCSFTNCQSTSGSGGAISSQLSNGELNIEDSTFDTCSATQPGNGGALSLCQYTTISIIKINNAAFTNCKTLTNPSNSTYGWGGAIFLFTSISSNTLSSSNLLMIDLAFSGCQSSIAGHNIHIRSPNTKETGLAISSNNLLTVNGTTDLYISPDYEFDYMGIDESKVNDGNNSPYKHLPLFASNIPIEAAKDYYINTDSGDDSGSCEEDQSSCQSITYILDFKGSLISDTGHLELYGLHFDNLISTTSAINPL
ncbi:MAG: hypothetical protein EZS28_044886, partial [Streblomastix strix]